MNLWNIWYSVKQQNLGDWETVMHCNEVMMYYRVTTNLYSVCLQQLCLLAFASVEVQEPSSTDGHTKNDDSNTMD